ncbi:MAG: conserved membrane protein of unknown function [Promethearchaeota archaeon]|nr:MAG: conserved membrane protein of unknown function [Candidatus Lokiarchaeota archaeon]
MYKRVGKKSRSLISDKLNALKNWLTTFKGGLTLFCLILLFIIPIFTQNAYYLGIFISAMIFSIFAASWDLLAGYAGQVSFGHAVFFGISGYITSFFLRFLQFPWWISLFIGSIIAVLFGLLIGIPSLRVKGPYLALVTMVSGLILFSLFMMGELSEILGGTEGISQIRPISENAVVSFYIILIFMVSSLVVMVIISKSNLGTIFKAIRDDETGAEASGINITKYKISAFVLSAFFAGIAGAFFAMHNRGVNPAVFQPLYSFYAIVMSSLGGIATIVGGAVGAFIFIFLTELLRDFMDVSVLILSLILIGIIRFAEHGILRPAIERLKELYDILLGR